MITSLRLQNFRSYEDESFDLDPAVNIIVGPNAGGKTNLLEAILVVCIGSSFRAHDAELIRFEKPWARVDAYTETRERIVKIIGGTDSLVRKEFEIDKQHYKRLSLGKKEPIVLFEPNHLQLLSGSPENRRIYLDDLLEQLVAGYGPLRRNYRRALAQRNALLKKGNVSPDQLFAWNVKLSEMGGQIAIERLTLVDKINNSLEALYVRLAKKDNKVEVRYASKMPLDQYSTELLKKLESNQEIDTQRGFTLYGPHRDDIVINLNDHSVQDIASRGETRTLLLGLKLVELALLETQHQQKPILLLDDVFSELDGSRRKALTDVLEGYQTFITTTDADVVIQNFTEAASIIPINTK